MRQVFLCVLRGKVWIFFALLQLLSLQRIINLFIPDLVLMIGFYELFLVWNVLYLSTISRLVFDIGL